MAFQISDNEKPVYNPALIPNINQNNEPGQKYASVTWTIPTPSDNSGTISSMTNSHSPGNFDIGTHTVVYTAKDPSDNTATLTFTITITG